MSAMKSRYISLYFNAFNDYFTEIICVNKGLIFHDYFSEIIYVNKGHYIIV